MGELPSGTVTFLFTDVERSTQSAEALGDERYAEALALHRSLLRDAFASHAGHEVGTEGDSFFVAFARAGDAVAAALDGQKALDRHDWPDGGRLRVRMGMHTGEALVREGDYVGHDVHKAKRISDAGYGGQILVSEATAGLVRDAHALVDLGLHRLKDLGEPQRLFQIGADPFPPLRSLEAFRHNLPPQRTTFVGREREITQALELLDGHRLVTLTGVGGCGKTRLALQVGAESLETYPDGVYFIDLAPVSDPDAIASTVATALGVAAPAPTLGGGGTTPEGAALAYLAERKALLIVDNCEHLLDACADLIESLLARCPNVTILATSREALDVEGEQSSRVPSLSLPDSDDVQSSEAVSLFKTRATAVRPDFDLAPDNVGDVAEICRRLDGIPLAIEFAASRVTHMSPREIADRLGDMFRLLSGGRRRVQRQQTLRAALDWSYQLLTEAERVLLRRLAVFAGAFTLGEAEGICARAPIEHGDVLDLLGSLVAKSLIATEESEGATRYRLSEPVRLYASEKLRDAEEADALRDAHRDWYLAELEAMSWDDALGPPGSGFLSSPLVERFVHMAANVRVALEWSHGQDRPDLIARMACRMHNVWFALAAGEEGLRWLLEVSPEELDVPTDVRVAVLAETSWLSISAFRTNALEHADRAVAVADGAPSVPLAFALSLRAMSRALIAEWTRNTEMAEAARADIAETHNVAQRADGGARWAYAMSAFVEMVLGDYAASAVAARALAHHGASGDVSLISGAAYHLLGEHDRAAEAARAHIATSRAMMDPDHPLYLGGIAPAIDAAALAGAGDLAASRELLLTHFEPTRRRRGSVGVVGMMIGFAVHAFLIGQLEAAARLLGWIRSQTIEAGRNVPGPQAYALYRVYMERLREALGTDELRRLRAEGREMSIEEVMSYARSAILPDDSPHGARFTVDGFATSGDG